MKDRNMVFNLALKEVRAGLTCQNKEQGPILNDVFSGDERVGEENENNFSIDSFFKTADTCQGQVLSKDPLFLLDGSGLEVVGLEVGPKVSRPIISIVSNKPSNKADEHLSSSCSLKSDYNSKSLILSSQKPKYIPIADVQSS